MQGLPIAVFVLVIPCLLCQKEPRAGSFSITEILRYVDKDQVDYYIKYEPTGAKPTVETTMTLNYWATNRTAIPSEGVFVEPRQSQIKGLVFSGRWGKEYARVTFNKTDFLDFVNGYMDLPYQPIVLVGFPNLQYFLIRLRVDFEWKIPVNKTKAYENNKLQHKGISFPRGDHLYFNVTSKRSIDNIMEFLIPEVFENTADAINSSRIHLSLFFVNSCDDTTSAYFQVKYKNIDTFFEQHRRDEDWGWGKMINYRIDYDRIIVKNRATKISLPINYSCDGDWSPEYRFPQGFISMRRRAVYSNRNKIIDEFSSKTILTFGYRNQLYGFPPDYGFIWEETTDSNYVKDCKYFGDSCVITCKFAGPNIVNVTVGKFTEEYEYVAIHSETRRTFEHMKMSIRLGLGSNRINDTYFCGMFFGYPKPIYNKTIEFDVVF